MEYEAVIGLETHVQLKTKSKMWCGCANAFGADPNTNVCPICLGMPGVLPVANAEAMKLTALTGMLLNCEIPRFAKFDRKNYFYPDSAKNYQVTQYDRPSTQNGWLEFEFTGPEAQDGLARVRITRAHLEEDVGKNNHFDRHSGVDFNRAGVPLLEIVSEPDLRGPEHAYAYLKALTDVLVRGGISDCDMEKGMVRCDVNVSVRPKGSEQLGAKIEIKNMNSFSGIRRALEYEIPRQIEAVKRGEKLRQETRRWDDVASITEPMRSKEDAHDYRYFPEPDLMPFCPTDEWLAEVRARVPELPLARKQRFMRDYGLPPGDADFFVSQPAIGEAFEGLAKAVLTTHSPDTRGRLLKTIANYLVNPLPAEFKAVGFSNYQYVPPTSSTPEVSGFEGYLPTGEPKRFTYPATGPIEIANHQLASTISGSVAPVVFREMLITGLAPAAIIEQRGLAQVSDTGTIEKLADEVIAANPGPAADFRAGKVAALNFLKGQVMKLSKGKANPALAGEVLEKKLKG